MGDQSIGKVFHVLKNFFILLAVFSNPGDVTDFIAAI